MTKYAVSPGEDFPKSFIHQYVNTGEEMKLPLSECPIDIKRLGTMGLRPHILKLLTSRLAIPKSDFYAQGADIGGTLVVNVFCKEEPAMQFVVSAENCAASNGVFQALLQIDSTRRNCEEPKAPYCSTASISHVALTLYDWSQLLSYQRYIMWEWYCIISHYWASASASEAAQMASPMFANVNDRSSFRRRGKS